MPNSANKSNGGSNAGKGAPKHATSKSTSSKPNPERSDAKRGGQSKDRSGDTGRTSSQGRKRASGGGINE
jgi:hypothetical protein